MPDVAQLSYQTTMPEYPDVSYQRWFNRYSHGSSSRLGAEITAWALGAPNYETWRQNQLDDYNARMSAYNTWLSTGAGIRASAKSGEYNPSYFQNGPAEASPLAYQDVNPGSGVSEMAQGISGIFHFIQAFQGMKLASEQIAGQKLKNEAQQIQNRYSERLLSGRAAGLNFQNDWLQMRNEGELYRQYFGLPELWKNGVFSPYGRGSYDLRQAGLGSFYQKADVDLTFRRAATDLARAQEDMAKWNAKEKKWFQDNIWQIQKDILNGQLTLQNGEIDFQAVRQKLYKAGVISNIANQTVNTAMNAIKSFIMPGLSLGTQLPGPTQFTSPYSPLGGGVDLSGYGAFGSY